MELDLACRRCPLSEGRTNVVFPDGDLDSTVCFVGEAPGRNEDMQGIPFVGRAGKMLDRLLAEEGLPRERVMITNTVKCRPPNNRVPTKGERAACFPYLEAELIGKRVVIALGRTACSNLLRREVKLADEANTVIRARIGEAEVDLIPAYHPMACLLNLDARESLRRTIRDVKRYLP